MTSGQELMNRNPGGSWAPGVVHACESALLPGSTTQLIVSFPGSTPQLIVSFPDSTPQLYMYMYVLYTVKRSMEATEAWCGDQGTRPE